MENKRKIKVCLFNPIDCVSYPPLNLTFLASYLLKYSKYEFEVKLIDANFSKNPIDDIFDFSPDVVGFTSLSPYILDIYDFCYELRQRNQKILYVCGGIHATINPEEVVEKGFDIAVVGEGEQTFQELLDKYVDTNGDIREEDLALIDGIVFKKSSGQIYRTKERELISSLDLVPHPDRSLLNNVGYHNRCYVTRGVNTPGVYTLHGSRGCPYQCIFCCVNFAVKSKVRLHSPEYIVDEMDILVKEYNAKWIFFTDDTFFIDKVHTERLCKLIIERGLNKKVNWEVQIRSNLIKDNDLELLCLMKEAGCRQIDIGFESANQRVLTLIKGKGITVRDHEKAISLTKAAGLKVLGTFILATPSETYEEMMDTVNFIKSNHKKIDNFQVGCMIPYPGTRAYELVEDRGLITESYLDMLRKHRENNVEHGAVVYSDTLSNRDVSKIRMELDNLSLRKITIGAKLKWFFYNATHNPKVAVSGCCWAVKRFFLHLKFILNTRKEA